MYNWLPTLFFFLYCVLYLVISVVLLILFAIFLPLFAGFVSALCVVQGDCPRPHYVHFRLLAGLEFSQLFETKKIYKRQPSRFREASQMRIKRAEKPGSH